ncbi:MarR family winged helix-turn-helix transcriptional regulator [Actinoallomurus bryophytorum]|uniref:Transcriptional regulator n=1 Tax=Actinoallomurus bryophytorum TaxID=1490222 RepID=A0A543BSU6_9ACTN|nr:MarR family winged helix-turn-helix transcriptional regulator [Actinoallomurus bryophytorum]TQL87909.1 transcriptional regulator [Actinoallomurus bryophytorum]
MTKPAGRPIGLTLARTAKVVGRAFEDTLAAAGGSTPIWLILISLKKQPTSNQRELAAAVGIQGATLTHHLNAMEADGLITRRRDPANRRVHQVRLTEQGETLFHRLATAARTHDQRLRTGFGEDELATLERLLGRMRTNVADDDTLPEGPLEH